jgi:conjugative relaxase-like TrwC/TraI family protein
MLSIAKLRVGQEAYHLSGVAQSLDEYYTGAGEATGRWVGGGAARLGLRGDVDADSLRAVLAGMAPGTGGLNPNGKQIRPSAHRVPGFDLTFKVPKSASVLYAVSDDPRVQGAVIEAGEAAAREAVAWLEREAIRAQRGSHNKAWLDRLRVEDPDAARRHGPRRITTSGVVGAAFRHRTSRAADPLLHWHVLVANLVEGNDGRWSAFAHPDLYRAARTAGEIFQAAVRRELTASLGVEWAPGRHVQEIAGIPSAILETFSKRRAEIEAWLATHGHADTPAAAQEATLATRRGKPELEGERLDAGWKREAITAGWGPESAAELVAEAAARTGIDTEEEVWRLPADPLVDPETGEVVATDRAVTPDEWIADLLRRLTQASTTFTRFDLTEAVAARLGPGSTLDTIERIVARTLASDQVLAVHQPDLPSPRGRTTYTSREMVAVEQRLLDTLSRLGSHSAIPVAAVDEAITARSGIGHDQAAAARTICAATGPIAVLVGPAGSGKTYTLDTIRHAHEAAGNTVIGAAPSARAAIELASGANIPSRTMHSLLSAIERGHLPADASTVLVIDEAGMADVRLLERLTTHVASSGGRIILVGDHHQLPEIDAGGGFEAASQRSATVAELTVNRRQSEPWEQEALEQLRNGSVPAAVRAYLDHERVVVAADRMHMVDTAVGVWRHSRDAGLDTVMLAGTNELVGVLNQAAIRSLVDDSQLDADAAGRFGRSDYRIGERVVLRRNSGTAINQDRQLTAVANGQFGTVADAGDGWLTVRRDHDDQLVTVDQRYLEDGGRVDHAYAITTTRSQGGTWDQAIAVGLDGLYREAAYVDFSRGRGKNLIVLAQPDIDHLDELAADSVERHDRKAIPLPSEQPAPAEEDLVATLQRSGAKHLAHTIDPDIDVVDEWARLNTLPDLEARRDHCRDIERLATERVGVHPDALTAAHQRAERVARFGRPGDTVKALDRHNIGTLIDHDDAHGRATVAFVSASGRTAERTLPWSELELHSDETTPRELPPTAQWWLDQHAKAIDATARDWTAFLDDRGVAAGEAELADRAARRKVERATNELIADRPDWLINLLGYQPADPIGLQTWTGAVRDIARWQLHAGPSAEEVAPELARRLLATRAWLDCRDTTAPAWPHRRSHSELVARRGELDEILDTAPSDQRDLINRLRAGEPRLLNDTAEALAEIVEHQRGRRDWILEHWTHIVEFAEVTQTLDAGLWGPDVETILGNIDPGPSSALADSLAADEPWLRLAIGRLAPQWTTELDDESASLLRDIADYRLRTGARGSDPIDDEPISADTDDERAALTARLDLLIDESERHVQLLTDPLDLDVP